jgi:RNA polymerase subunit RPABC4/transcription elongation factor Spt4
MVIYLPKMKVKISCTNCHWYLILVAGGYGDILKPSDRIKMFLNRQIEKCPECGSTELESLEPSLSEKLNIFEYIRKVKFALKRKT